MKKVLIITHSSNFMYGAAKSLEFLIANIDWDIDFISPKFYLHPFTKDEIKKYTHNRCNNTKSMLLKTKIDTVYEKSYKKSISNQDKLKQMLKNRLSFFDRTRLYKMMKNNRYDYVLLNSMILYDYIDNHNKYILYIREKFVGDEKTYKRLISKMRLAEKIIFIDPLLLEPFKKDLNTFKSYKCINNPFDMSNLNNQTFESACENLDLKEGLLKNQIVVSCIGVIMQEKGIDFIINSFVRANRKDIKLLIAGSGKSEYLSYCKKIANDNVIFIGEVEDILNVYKISDYIIRGDQDFATGRTVYEGLYAGCYIIMQGNKTEAEEKMFEYSRFKERVIFYKSRDIKELQSIFTNIKKNEINNIAKSNIEEYINKIKNYID